MHSWIKSLLLLFPLVLFCACGGKKTAIPEPPAAPAPESEPVVKVNPNIINAPFLGLESLAGHVAAKDLVESLDMERANISLRGVPVSIEVPAGTGIRSYNGPVYVRFETHKSPHLKKQISLSGVKQLSHRYSITISPGHYNLEKQAMEAGAAGVLTNSSHVLVHKKGVWVNGTYGNLDLRMHTRFVPKSCGAALLLRMASSVQMPEDFEPLDSVEKMENQLGFQRNGAVLTAKHGKIRITDSTLAIIVKDKTITKILGIDNVTDAGLAHLANNPGITALSFYESHGAEEVTVEGLQQLKDMKNLKELKLSVTDKVTSLSFLEGVRLEKLGLFTRHMTREAIDEVPERFPELVVFYAYDSGKLIDDDFVETMSSLPKLVRFGLQYSTVTDACLPHLLKMESLSQFSFSGNKVTDVGIAELLKKKPQLTNKPVQLYYY